jgi:hypothetical protein
VEIETEFECKDDAGRFLAEYWTTRHSSKDQCVSAKPWFRLVRTEFIDRDELYFAVAQSAADALCRSNGSNEVLAGLSERVRAELMQDGLMRLVTVRSHDDEHCSGDCYEVVFATSTGRRIWLLLQPLGQLPGDGVAIVGSGEMVE